MRRTLIGVFLVMHGLAHSTAGALAADRPDSWLLGGLGEWPQRWIATLLWCVAMVGFVAAGFGVLGLAGLRRHARTLALAAASASLLLLALFLPPTATAGAVLDLAVLAYILAPFPRIAGARASAVHAEVAS